MPVIAEATFMIERFYHSVYRIRKVEEKIAAIYPTDKIQSPVHLSIGQEAISVAVCAALQAGDVVFGSYRCHALYLAKGGDLRRMIAELYGKATGCAKGKGGSMHMIDVAAGVMGASAVVGTTIPQAVGYALAMKMRSQGAGGKGQEPGGPTHHPIVASFFGEGAIEEGALHESFNFAALKKVPILFICENNGLAIHSRQQDRQAVSMENLVQSYGIDYVNFDSMDILQIHEGVAHAAAEIRAGRSGPCFFECTCYRWREHVGPGEDFFAGYRARAEAEPWFANDQVARLAGMLAPAIRARIEQEVDREIQDAFDFAESSPFPEDAELLTDLYK
jgi:TPP-dependent pyruvate/acetoin dehydrogenase alpha subunit